MKTTNKKRHAGFTLIEVLIVVTIMAILAATIIPQFTSSAEEAKDSQLEFNLNTMRSQIQLYHLQHNGSYPATLAKLVVRTDVDGTTNASGAFGPYMTGGVLPKNPKTDSNAEGVSTTGTETTGVGWLYDAATGNIWSGNPVP